ncbi:MAG: DUF4469 domain-containing protein [Roseimicrobium sp.]
MSSVEHTGAKGSFTDPETPLTADLISPTLNIYLSNPLQQHFRNGITIERTGIEQARAPIVSLFRDDRTATLDAYTAGDILLLTGSNLKLDVTDPQQGVFFTPASGGAEVRATRYVSVSDANISILTPAALTGAQNLTVRVKYGTALRSALYGNALQKL